MRRADRLFQIVQYLRGGRLTTAAVLAERLEVSERTIYRDIRDLQGTGVPIDGEAGVGYILREGFDLPPMMFTRDEIAALTAGARLVRAWGGLAMAQAAEEALVKIEAVLPKTVRAGARDVEIHAIGVNMTDANRLRLDQLDGAVEARMRLAFHYTDESGRHSARTVRPLGLWFWGKVWTLVAWCELREDFRMFRIDRMEQVAEVGPFRPTRDHSLSAFFKVMGRRDRFAGQGSVPGGGKNVG